LVQLRDDWDNSERTAERRKTLRPSEAKVEN
jgi:hypothetical protein